MPPEPGPAVVTPETYTVARTVHIRASRHKVWAAITRPELIAQWFGQRAELDGVAVGSSGIFGWDDHGDFPVTVVELDEPHVFAFRWAGEDGATLRDDNATLARFTLEDADDGTLLTVVETGFEHLAGGEAHRLARLEDNREGWDSELDELVTFLERSAA